MDTIQALKNRRSIRSFEPRSVDKKLMEEIVEVARFAPSWANTQIARYTVVNAQDVIQNISQNGVKGFVYNQKTLENAHTVVVLSYVEGKSGNLKGQEATDDGAKMWEAFDAGIACQTFCMAAFAKGVGSCIFGVIDQQLIADMINLPQDETVAAVIVCGYPQESPKAPRRHNVEEILRFI